MWCNGIANTHYMLALFPFRSFPLYAVDNDKNLSHASLRLGNHLSRPCQRHVSVLCRQEHSAPIPLYASFNSG